jgi:environmental stress-induced protein Ves
MTHWRLEDSVATPWANGGGLTREVTAHRQGEQVLWRLSVAEIAADGPFSAFAGVARVHVIIKGAGLDLRGVDGVLAARPFVPLAFDGALALEARLLDGPCRAFNVMYDPAAITAEVIVQAGASAFRVAAGTFVHVALGRAEVEDGTGLTVGDTLCPDRAVTLHPGKGAQLICARFEPLPK